MPNAQRDGFTVPKKSLPDYIHPAFPDIPSRMSKEKRWRILSEVLSEQPAPSSHWEVVDSVVTRNVGHRLRMGSDADIFRGPNQLPISCSQVSHARDVR